MKEDKRTLLKPEDFMKPEKDYTILLIVLIGILFTIGITALYLSVRHMYPALFETDSKEPTSYLTKNPPYGGFLLVG